MKYFLPIIKGSTYQKGVNPKLNQEANIVKISQ